MDFGLSAEQVLLQDTVRRYLDGECSPARVRAIMETADGHDPALWRGLAALGVAGLQIPEAHGGAGLDLLDVALVAEVLGWACTPGPFLGVAMATAALLAADDRELRSRLLPRIASGELVATVALAEPGERWDAAAVATCVEDGRVTGTKPLVPYAAVADVILVPADDGAGTGLWLVERGAPGLTVTSLQGLDMTRRVADVALAGAPATRVAAGTAAITRAYEAGLVLLAADAYGGARRCLEMTRGHVLAREQFGQPIGAFQAVKHQLADLVTALEPSLSLWWYAAHAHDHLRDRAARHASLAKAHLTDLYDEVTRVATELHGGIGFTWEFDLHLWFRRAVFDRHFLGGAAVQRARAAALAGW